jgi:hypothetical protein
MTDNGRLARFGGIIFAVGGALTLVGSALHPTGGSSNYHASIAKQLAKPIGTPAAWLTLAGSLLIAWALWVLLDSAWRNGSPVVHLGARLAIIGSVLLTAESAATLAMRTAAVPYAAGTPVPMVRLSEALYAGCLPALMLGALMVNLGSPRLAPKFIQVIGAIGMVALGLAGPLVDGAHNIKVWPLYLGGVLVCVWIIWAGVRLATFATATPSVEPTPVGQPAGV